eukprot:3576721-Amphidinium_carterae.1
MLLYTTLQNPLLARHRGTPPPAATGTAKGNTEALYSHLPRCMVGQNQSILIAAAGAALTQPTFTTCELHMRHVVGTVAQHYLPRQQVKSLTRGGPHGSRGNPSTLNQRHTGKTYNAQYAHPTLH